MRGRQRACTSGSKGQGDGPDGDRGERAQEMERVCAGSGKGGRRRETIGSLQATAHASSLKPPGLRPSAHFSVGSFLAEPAHPYCLIESVSPWLSLAELACELS